MEMKQINAQKVKPSKNKSVQETLKEIYKQKEENKEIRQSKKLALFEKLFNK